MVNIILNAYNTSMVENDIYEISDYIPIDLPGSIIFVLWYNAK